MKIKLLFAPVYNRNVASHIPPLGMAMVCGYLKKLGHIVDQDDLQIKVVNENANTLLPKNRIILSKKINMQLLRNQNPDPLLLSTANKLAKRTLELTDISKCDVIGFSILEAEQLFASLLLAKYINEKYSVKILFGGLAFRLCEQYGIKNMPLIQESMNEPVCKELMKALSAREIQDQIPDFDGLPLKLYKNPTMNYNVTIPYQLDYGCVYKCSFCMYPSAVDHLHLMQPEKAVRDLAMLKEKYKTSYFDFGTATINNDPKKLEELCDLLIEKGVGIKWMSFASPSNLTLRLVRKMRKSGCQLLRLGIESGSETMLRRMRKPFTINKARDVLKINKKCGITNRITLIAGYPYETDSDIKATKDFIKSNKNAIDIISVKKFFLSRLSPMFRNPQAHKIHIVGPTNSLQHEYAFDEIEGLSWDEKQKQMEQSRMALLETIYYSNKTRPKLYGIPVPKTIPYKLYRKIKTTLRNNIFIPDGHLLTTSDIAYHH